MENNFLSYGINENCTTNDFIEGRFLLLNKPIGWSSFDLVNKIRILLRQYLGLRKSKVGHAGTLDPLATGLMIICIGKMTKKIELLMGMDKEYVAGITFGGITPSYDLETEVESGFDYLHINKENINSVLNNFLGKQMQTPPLFSAIRINGKRAYEHARKGDDMELQQREVVFNELELIDYEAPVAKVRINCSKGTYIRSFANDLGKAIESGAYLSSLERTKTGVYSLNDAITMEQFESILKKIKEEENERERC